MPKSILSGISVVQDQRVGIIKFELFRLTRENLLKLRRLVCIRGVPYSIVGVIDIFVIRIFGFIAD